MLVLKLKKADRVRVGDLVFEIKDAGAGRVRIAFGAPKGVAIQNEQGAADSMQEAVCELADHITLRGPE